MEYTDEKFIGKNYYETGFDFAEFDGCSFENCNFSETDLKGSIFIACSFINCNLSLTRINKVSLQQVMFIGCKLLGIHFEDANPFSLQMSFENCNLESASTQMFRVPTSVVLTSQTHVLIIQILKKQISALHMGFRLILKRTG